MASKVKETYSYRLPLLKELSISLSLSLSLSPLYNLYVAKRVLCVDIGLVVCLFVRCRSRDVLHKNRVSHSDMRNTDFYES